MVKQGPLPTKGVGKGFIIRGTKFGYSGGLWKEKTPRHPFDRLL